MSIDISLDTCQDVVMSTYLSDKMEFDRVVEVHADGKVTDAPGVYAPDLDYDSESVPAPWTLLTGYTGQYGYNGPCMHPSEYIGGRLAQDIITTPGYYVAMVLEDSDGGEPAGWCIATRPV